MERSLRTPESNSDYLWGEAIHYANDEKFFKRKPNYKVFKTFGSLVEFKDNNIKSKLEDRTTTGLYLRRDGSLSPRILK